MVATIGVCLRLVREEGLQEDSSFAPNTVRPLKDFDAFRQCIPTFQEGSKTLMSDLNAPASGPLRAIFSAELGSGRLFLVKYRDHANHNPAPRFRAHVVMNTAQRHCQGKRSVCIASYSYSYLFSTLKYMQIHVHTCRYVIILTNTCTYLHFILRHFWSYSLGIATHTCTYLHDTNRYIYIPT